MIDAYLDQLYAEGTKNDSEVESRSERMFNITPSTGRFLDVLISDSRPERILELGTSNGYSTIWIARAARNVASVIESVDISAAKTEAAASNLRAVGLDACVRLHTGNAGEFLSACEPHRYDFVFLDSARAEYVAWWEDLVRVTNFGTMVVDNAISHASELQPFFRCVEDCKDYAACVLPIGKGQMVIRSRP